MRVRLRGASTADHGWPGHRFCVFASLAVVTSIVYGSLVPFDLTWSDAPELRGWPARVQFSPWSDVSSTDLLVNLGVGMPLGFVLMGALRGGRRRSPARAAVAILAVVCRSAILSGALELLQVLSPTRRSSWNDVVCQAIGAGLGALVWTIVGRSFIEWLLTGANERSSSGFAAWLLQLFLPMYLLIRLTPFDTGQAAQIAANYNTGTSAIAPTELVDPPFVMALDLAGNALLAVPIGALAVLGWIGKGTRRTVGRAIALGLSIVVAVGVAQEFVWRRHGGTIQLLVGTVGVMIGVAAATAVPRSRMTTSVSRSRSSHSWFLLAAGIWLLVLLGHSWYPFDFDLTSEAVWSRLTRISLVPFGFYYWYAIYIVNPLEAVHETLLNFALAVPLGFFMRLAWPDAGKRRAIVAATIALLAMEAGQSFLPMRFPDVTDALVGAIGALVGAMMAAGFASRQHKSPAATALQTNQPATRDDSGTGRRVSSWE